MSKSGVELNLDMDAIRRVAQDAFDEYLERGVEYVCPECGETYALVVGENPCPKCGFVITVEKGELRQ